jgi:peptidoglycan/xylan/chitin deacetylase (PgdA/CDA1 family)
MVASLDRDFVGYGKRAPLISWPGKATIAVNLVIVYEEGSEYSVVEGDGRNDGWGEYQTNVDPEIRDLGSETHFEYGSRAGIWRIARLIDHFQVPVTVSATAQALERNPEVAAWMRANDHDLLGHGLRWTEFYRLTREEERAQLREAISAYERVLRQRPLGWNSRSFPSVNTFELIQEEGGFLYYSDPCNDDLPYFQRTPAGRMLIVPYSKTYNDSRFLVSPGYSKPQDFAADVCAGIDFLEDEAQHHGARMMTIAVHARWTGQANRASALRDILKHVASKPRVAFMRRLDIAQHFIMQYSDLPTLPRI